MKRNLVLLSSLLVLGLLGTAGTALAQSTVLGVSSSIDQVRAEGTKEATGQVVLTSSSAGTIKTGSIISLTYGANLAVAVVAGNVTFSNGAATWTATGATAQPVVKITFTGDVAMAPGDTITVSGIRVNANAVGSGAINSNVAAVVPAAFSGTNAITFSTGTSVQVANVNPKAVTYTLSAGPSAILSCLVGANPGSFQLSMKENFAQALTSQTDEDGLSGAGTSTNGSNVQVVFTGVPKGVSIAYGSVDAASSATLVVALDATTPASQTGAKDNDTLTFVFDVNGTDTTAIETLLINFNVTSPAVLANGLTPNTVTGTMSLTSKQPTATTDVPTFTGTEGAVTVISVSDCITNLLFPWVVADAPGGTFDTGMAIANTTKDGFSTGAAAAQTGSCALTGWQSDGSGIVTATVGPIVAGGTGTVVLSSQTGWAGFRGYVIAVCQFQGAHGFAFITQDNATANGTSQGYLGLVIPNPSLVNRNPAGGGAGESLGN